jgi:hypothetical protein
MSPFCIELECRLDVVPEAGRLYSRCRWDSDGHYASSRGREWFLFLESWQEITTVRKPIIAAASGYMVNTVSIHPFNPTGVLTCNDDQVAGTRLPEWVCPDYG